MKPRILNRRNSHPEPHPEGARSATYPEERSEGRALEGCGAGRSRVVVSWFETPRARGYLTMRGGLKRLRGE